MYLIYSRHAFGLIVPTMSRCDTEPNDLKERSSCLIFKCIYVMLLSCMTFYMLYAEVAARPIHQLFLSSPTSPSGDFKLLIVA